MASSAFFLQVRLEIRRGGRWRWLWITYFNCWVLWEGRLGGYLFFFFTCHSCAVCFWLIKFNGVFSDLFHRSLYVNIYIVFLRVCVYLNMCVYKLLEENQKFFQKIYLSTIIAICRSYFWVVLLKKKKVKIFYSQFWQLICSTSRPFNTFLFDVSMA